MKGLRLYLIFTAAGIVSMTVLFVLMKATADNLKDYNCNSKAVISVKQDSSNNSKKINSFKCSDIIHFVNLYNAQINEFKINNNILNVNLQLEGEKENISRFLKEIESNENLYRINLISLEKKSMNEQHCELNIDIEFKV